MFGKTFHFGLIRKYVTLMGTLLNDIHIMRVNDEGTEQLMKVPLTYAPRERMLARITEDENIDRPYATILPAISFVLDNMRYDIDRKFSTTQRRYAQDATDKNKIKYQYTPVPWIFSFHVFVFAKNTEDGNKIIEQILPYFTPHWSVSVNLIPEMEEVRDIDIVLNDVELSDNYAGRMDERWSRRTITWTIRFTLKGYLYGPTKTSSVIKFANVSIYVPTTNTAAEGVGVTDAIDRITVKPGLTANGLPTSNANNSIDYLEINADDDFGYIIEKELLINE